MQTPGGRKATPITRYTAEGHPSCWPSAPPMTMHLCILPYLPFSYSQRSLADPYGRLFSSPMAFSTVLRRFRTTPSRPPPAETLSADSSLTGAAQGACDGANGQQQQQQQQLHLFSSSAQGGRQTQQIQQQPAGAGGRGRAGRRVRCRSRPLCRRASRTAVVCVCVCVERSISFIVTLDTTFDRRPSQATRACTKTRFCTSCDLFRYGSKSKTVLTTDANTHNTRGYRRQGPIQASRFFTEVRHFGL